jgi:hypothetical protein
MPLLHISPFPLPHVHILWRRPFASVHPAGTNTVYLQSFNLVFFVPARFLLGGVSIRQLRTIPWTSQPKECRIRTWIIADIQTTRREFLLTWK